MGFHWLVLVLLCCLSSATISSPSSMRSDCQRRCGNLSIPYPFGMGHDPTCFIGDWFNITCDESATPPKALLWGDEVLDISILQGQLKIKSSIAWNCYSKSNYRGNTILSFGAKGFKGRPYTFSSTRNKFIAIGCNTQAYVTGYRSISLLPFTFGCMTFCSDTASVINGSCTGIGCCQSSIPPGLTSLQVEINGSSNHKSVSSFNPCSYAFIVDQDDFNFSLLDLFRTSSGYDKVPVVFDWVMGRDWNGTCQGAMSNETGYACLSENSYCYESPYVPGYRCGCSPGYGGNPYVHGGCKDIDECENKEDNNCTEICINIPGSYHCKCPKGYDGDGWNNGTSCIAVTDVKEFPLLKVILGIGLSLLFLLVASTWTYWLWRKRRSMKLREKFFHQNGGLMLQQKITSRRGDTFKIFTIEELQRATNNYNANTVVGQGGFGIVYKGVLPNNRIVAIKKSKLVDASQIEQFINELDILSQINHRNVVKLLGCCLEDPVPILVYEFISNGTLYHHIHEARHLPSISLKNRLNIAIEIAEALAYLHSHYKKFGV